MTREEANALAAMFDALDAYRRGKVRLTRPVKGVEDKLQADLLRMLGCDQVQGYYFAWPMPPLHVPQFLAAFSESETRTLKTVA